jgi:hypothetical protein
VNAWPDGYTAPTYNRPHVCGWGETHKRLERMKAAARDLWNHTVAGGLVIDDTLLPQRAIDEIAVMMTRMVAEGKHGRDDWRGQSLQYHVDHMHGHLVAHLNGQETGEDDLLHAACRALMAVEQRLVHDLPAFAVETDHVKADVRVFEDDGEPE